jgi:hypothetical protein
MKDKNKFCSLKIANLILITPHIVICPMTFFGDFLGNGFTDETPYDLLFFWISRLCDHFRVFHVLKTTCCGSH